MANVLLVTKGTGGDLSPFLGIGNRLRERGHAVTLLTHCHYANVAGQAGLDFVALDTPNEFEQFIADGYLLNAPQGIPVFFRRYILPQVRSDYAKIEECYVSGQTVLVAGHMSDIAARFVAEKFEIPFVRVFVAPSRATGVPLLVNLCTHILGPDINHSRAEIGFPPVTDWHSWLQYPKRSIGLWPDWFGRPEPGWPPGVTLTGFLGYDEVNAGDIPQAIQEILDYGEQPVLITGGTGMFGGDEIFSVCVKACQLLGCRGLLIAQQRSLVPKCLPNNVAWFERVPSLASLMPHMGAIIHHGGIGTLGQALAAGIPQLALAVGADRPDSAYRLQQLGVAEFLRPPQWQADIVAETLQRLIDSAEVRERCHEVAGLLQNTDSAAAACDVIEEALVEGDPLPEHVTLTPAASNVAMAEVEKGYSGGTGRFPNGLAHLSAERRALLALRLGKSQSEKREQR